MYQGSIHLIIGPMFSGKTSELLRLKNRTDIAGRKSIIIRYQNDTRYGNDDKIYTHDKKSYDCIVSVKDSIMETLESHNILIGEYQYIYIDEIQFYNDSADACTYLANNDVNVVVSGLSGTFDMKIFKSISELIPIADKITHLTAVDKNTGKDAAFTKRTTESKDLEVIGGCEIYKACDRSQYFVN